MNLGNKIQEIRKKNKMSQEDFAEVFNVTRQTISSWENSKSYPDIETLIKLSDKFDISLDILLKEDKVMIKEIDKERKNYKIIKFLHQIRLHNYKIIKKVLFIICCVLIIAGIIYGVNYVSFNKKYNAVKNEIETKYYQTLKDYKFEKKDRLYTLNISDDVKFVAGSQGMPSKKDRVLHFYAKFLYAYIDNDDSKIEIIFNDFNEFYLSKNLKDKDETTIFNVDELKEKDRNNIDVISKKIGYDKSKLEEIINQGFKIYNDLYLCELCR